MQGRLPRQRRRGSLQLGYVGRLSDVRPLSSTRRRGRAGNQWSVDWLPAALLGGFSAMFFNTWRLHDELREMSLLVSWPATKLVLMIATLSFIVGAAAADAVRTVGDAVNVALLETPYAFIISGVALTQLLSLIRLSVGNGDLSGLPAWEAVWAYFTRRLKEEIASNRLARAPILAREIRRLGNNPSRLARRMTREIIATRAQAEAADGVGRINAVLASHRQDRMTRLVELIYLLRLRPLLRTLKAELRSARPIRPRRRGKRARAG
jgi:hypothetical protein